MRRIATTVIAAALLLGAHSALAASAGDPQDTPKGLDVARSSIRTVKIDKGVFRARLAVSTYKAFDLSDGKGSFYWQIDSYGSASVDYVAYMFGDPNATPPRPLLCLVRSTNPKRPFRAYVHVAATNTRVVCGLPARDLHTTKSVRWRLAGRLHGVTDRAPDSGWNGG
jgi:hypothetical protein